MLGIYSEESRGQVVVPKKLNLGEQVPDLPLSVLYNYQGNEDSLGDFKGKLLILDFWATWCAPCIAAFPKMDALRRKYKDKIQILPVTTESKEKVQTLFKNIKNEKGLDLFSVVSDEKISSLFNYKTLPHYVIIDDKGKYISDALSEEINDRSIEAFLSGEAEAFSVRKTVVKRYDYNSPLFNQYISITEDGAPVIREITQDKINVKSILSKSIEGITGPMLIRKGRVLMVNIDIGKIFRQLFGRALTGDNPSSDSFYFSPNNRLIWEVGNKELLNFSADKMNTMFYQKVPGWRQFMRDHIFCYEIKAEDSISGSKMARLAINDLNCKLKLLYNFTARHEKRLVKCWVLKRTSSIDKVNSIEPSSLRSNEENLKTNFYDYTVKGKPFRLFMLQLVALDLQNISTPIIDETGFAPDKKVDISLKAKMNDKESINAALAKYDLTFSEEIREIEMIVISDTTPLQLFPVF